MQKIDNSTLITDKEVFKKLRDAGFKDLDKAKIQVQMNEIGKIFASIDYGPDDMTAFYEIKT